MFTFVLPIPKRFWGRSPSFKHLALQNSPRSEKVLLSHLFHFCKKKWVPKTLSHTMWWNKTQRPYWCSKKKGKSKNFCGKKKKSELKSLWQQWHQWGKNVFWDLFCSFFFVCLFKLSIICVALFFFFRLIAYGLIGVGIMTLNFLPKFNFMIN